MTPEEKEIERLRDILRERMRRVPDRIHTASIQAVRDYKSAYTSAKKTIEKRSATLHELQATINQVS